jgi:hypothetical protein
MKAQDSKGNIICIGRRYFLTKEVLQQLIKIGENMKLSKSELTSITDELQNTNTVTVESSMNKTEEK